MGPYGRNLARHGYNVWDELHSAAYPQHATVRSAFPEEHQQTTWITDWALKYLARHPADRPFFVWVSYVRPHHPYNPPVPYDTLYDPEDMPLPVWREREVEEWPDAYRRKCTVTAGGHEAVGMCRHHDEDWRRIKATCYGMISLIDKNIGRLIEALRDRGQLEDTVVIFTADHGENLGDHHLLFKGTTYDCVTAMPFTLSWPGHVLPAEIRDPLASAIDIRPTLLELVGVASPRPSPTQGTSLVPALTDEGYCVRDAVLMESAALWRSVRTRDGLLTWHGPRTRGELGDLSTNPHCLYNLWGRPEAAARQSELLHLLIQLMAENVDPRLSGMGRGEWRGGRSSEGLIPSRCR